MMKFDALLKKNMRKQNEEKKKREQKRAFKFKSGNYQNGKNSFFGKVDKNFYRKKPNQMSKVELSERFKSMFSIVAKKFDQDKKEVYKFDPKANNDDNDDFSFTDRKKPMSKGEYFEKKLNFMERIQLKEEERRKIAEKEKIEEHEEEARRRRMREKEHLIEKNRMFRKDRKRKSLTQNPGPVQQKKIENYFEKESKILTKKELCYRDLKKNRPPQFLSETYKPNIMQEQSNEMMKDFRRRQREVKSKQLKEQQEKLRKERRRYEKKHKIEQEQKEKKIREERKRRFMEERAKERKKKEWMIKMMQDKDKRRKALENSHRVEIRKDLKASINMESANFQKDITYFLKKILTEKYFIEAGENKPNKIPSSFRSSEEYLEYFFPCFLQECKYKLKESLSKSYKEENREFVEVDLEYLEHESDNFCIFDIQEVGKTQAFLYRKNMVVLITNKAFFELDEVNSFKDDFALMGVLIENQEKTGNLRLMVPSEYRKIVLQHVKKSSMNHLKLFKVDKMTSEIREFLGLKNLEFDFISKLIYEPKYIASETTKKHNIDMFMNFFKNIKTEFNRGQMKAIQNICLIKQGIKLLQGPPGTGKTHTLLGITSGLYFYMKKHPQNCRKQILICTPSNYAIDEIILRLLDKGLFDENGKRFIPKVVRLGVMNKIKNPKVLEVCMKTLVEKEMKKINFDNTLTEMSRFTDHQLNMMNQKLREDIMRFRSMKGTKEKTEKLRKKRERVIDEIVRKKRLKMKKKDELEKLEERILSECEIICCTLNSSGSEKLDRYEHNIEAIIVDEAAQSTEPTNIIPFRFKANKVILIGDPMQLPATTFGRDSAYTGYNRSLFERILATGVKIEFLYTQYRMLPELRQFPSDEFYKGRLKDSAHMALRQFPENLEFLKENNHLFFNLGSSKETKEGYSYYNMKEINLCTELVYGLKDTINNFNIDSVAVISPYKSQINKLRGKLSSEIENGILEVNTVDAFQGQEKDIIIFSCVRSGKDIGFLRDIRRLNVAITRAKYGLFVVGKAGTLIRDQTWSNFMHIMNTNQKCVGVKNLQSFKKKLSILLQGKKLNRDPLNVEFKPFKKDKNSLLGKRMSYCFPSGKNSPSALSQFSASKKLKLANSGNKKTNLAFNEMHKVIQNEKSPQIINNPNLKIGRGSLITPVNKKKKKNKLSQLISNSTTTSSSLNSSILSKRKKNRLGSLLSNKGNKMKKNKTGKKKSNGFDLASISKGFDFYDKMAEEIKKN